MMNQIKISQSTEEIVLNINVSSEMKEVIEELKTKLPKLKEFYQADKTPIRITGRIFSSEEQEIIKHLILQEIDVKIKFDEVSDLLGLHAIKKTFEGEIEKLETKFVKGSMRSGQKEEFQGNIVIIGDVNFGAEVIAGGSIVVVGTLRGLAHAGANGNKKAIITANTIGAIQVRIANLVKEIPENTYKCVYISIDGNTIEIE